MTELNECSIVCDFCAKKRKFHRCKQVSLKVDKTNSYQLIFGMLCSVCEKGNVKKTLQGQNLKIITSRNRWKTEESIFGEEEKEY